MSEGPLNGKTGEVLRFVAVSAVAGLVAYFTAIGTLQTRVSVTETEIRQIREELQFIRYDIRELVNQGR